jgi:membrane protease YdiL (CAAX protease family)
VSVGRASALGRAVVFLLLFSPFYLLPRLVSVGPVVMAVVLLVVTFLFLRSERRSLSALGLELSWRTPRALLLGWIGGALLIVIMAIGVRLTLPHPWLRNPGFRTSAAVFSLLYLLAANGVEELIFRGYSFERLIVAIGHWPAQIVTALLFAMYHIAEGWPWQTALIGTTAGSLLFGLVFVRWRSVPAALGVHAAGNWVRDLLLDDPPTAKTLYAPLAPRMWSSREQMMAMAIFTVVTLAACVALSISISRQRREAAASSRM